MGRWAEFTQRSTMHGLASVFSTEIPTVRRMIWGMLILGSLSYFIGSSYKFMQGFSQRLVKTNIRVESADQLSFPTVTFCNRNLWSYSALRGLNDDLIFGIFEDLYGKEPAKAYQRYNWSDPLLKDYVQMDSKGFERFMELATLSINDTMLGCYIFGVVTNCEDVIKIVKTDGGFCFQFNSNGSYNAIASGSSGGIAIVIDTKTQDYTTGPRSFAEGISIAFHEPHQAPIITEIGVGVGPGSYASIVLQKSQISRMPPPADNKRSKCFDTKTLPNPLYFHKSYSYSACQVECETSYVLRKCGCKDIFQPALNNSQSCTIPQMMNCSEAAMRRFVSDDEKGLVTCGCRDPCEYVGYEAQVSTYKFPSYNYAKQNNLSADRVMYMRENLIYLDIYYGKLSYKALEEDLAYTIPDMIANIGGTLGLCVGASILTLCEFVELVLTALISCLSHRSKSGRPVKVLPVAGIKSEE